MIQFFSNVTNQSSPGIAAGKGDSCCDVDGGTFSRFDLMPYCSLTASWKSFGIYLLSMMF